MLCRALTDTGVVGRPEEYFLSVDEAAQPEWKCWEEGFFGFLAANGDRESYLEGVYRVGTTPNGIFGAKLMWNNVRWALAKFGEMPRFAGLTRAEVFHSAFPDLHVIHLTRRDRARQAVSWARAAHDGVWVVSDDEPAAPVAAAAYDFELISNLEALIIEGENGWRSLFTELGVVPHEVVYEDFVTEAGYERTLRGIAAHLGLDDAELQIPPPRTLRQSDRVNESWLARYRDERTQFGQDGGQTSVRSFTDRRPGGYTSSS
jgi:trehalose 2-sulfotransferase